MRHATSFIRPVIRASLAVLFCGVAHGAMAQDANSATSSVQDAAEADPSVSEIIVIARRRLETGNYRSDFSSNASASIYTWVDGFSLSNLRFGFRTHEGFNIFGWVRNVFDEEYFEQLAVGPSSTGLIAGQPGDPRTYGLTLKASF